MIFKATFVCCVALAHAYTAPYWHNAKLITKINQQIFIIKTHQTKISDQTFIIKEQAQTILRLSRGRAVVLAAQILYLQIGKQPKPSAQPSRYFRQTNISLLAPPRELDLLVDARNAFAHPCCPNAIHAEAIELLALLGTSNHSLSKEEQLALQVLASFICRNNSQGPG